VDARACASGFVNGSFSDCLPAYNALVTGARVPWTPAACYGVGLPGNASDDGGPLVWPARGYVNTTGGKASYGVRQPGALLGWDGGVYLLYIDNDFDRADVWAARAAPGSAEQGAPGSFAAFDHVNSTWTLPALPAGFDKLRFAEFLGTPSPAGASGRGAPLFALFPTAASVHAAAARLTKGGVPTSLHVVVYDLVNYTECWPTGATSPGRMPAAKAGDGLGSRVARELLTARARAELPVDGCIPVWRLFLRVTEDFVTFSEPAELASLAAPGFGNSLFQYAVLLSADGTLQDEVDADGFLVMGTCAMPGPPCGASYGSHVVTASVTLALDGAGGPGPSVKVAQPG